MRAAPSVPSLTCYLARLRLKAGSNFKDTKTPDTHGKALSVRPKIPNAVIA